MPSAREMRLRIRSVRNIAQVTRALEAVSASKVRRAMQAVAASRPYSEKAWKLLVHLARQPGTNNLHPLLNERAKINKILAVLITGDRGLAGAYNINVLRSCLMYLQDFEQPISYLVIGQKGRDMLIRRRKHVVAEFNHLPSPPTYKDVSAIGKMVVESFLNHEFDGVFLFYTEFRSLIKQEVTVRKLLPLEIAFTESGKTSFNTTHKTNSVFTYEPDESGLVDLIVPRFTALQVYQSILSSQASEHAARMVTMRNATDNAQELKTYLQLEYNKFRQQSITNDILDIAGGAEALQKLQAKVG